MALQTLMLYTESNLVGRLTQGIGENDTTVEARFYDNTNGDSVAPESTTRVFVIDKGSPTQPSSSYEIIYTPDAPVTTSGVTVLTNCVRGLAFDGVSLAASAGKAKIHGPSAPIGVVDLHIFINALVATLKGVGDQPKFKIYANAAARNADVSAAEGMYCFLQDVNILCYYDGTNWVPASTTIIFADAAARDAYFPSPFTGLSCYLTTEGYYTDYIGGGWVQRATGAIGNASTSARGAVQEATDAQVAAQTATGSTGARTFISPASTSVTGTAEKVPVTPSGQTRLNKTWLWDEPYLELTTGENITAADPIYIKGSDGLAYKATNASIEAANVVGIAMSTVTTGNTVYVQCAGEITGLSGLTAGRGVYLGASGLTTTVPAVISTAASPLTTIPVRVGTATSTTKMIFKPQRFQRIYATGDYIDPPTLTNQSYSAGFPVEKVVGWNNWGIDVAGTDDGTYISSLKNTYYVQDNIMLRETWRTLGSSSGVPQSGGSAFLLFIGTSSAYQTYYDISVAANGDITLTATNSGSPSATITYARFTLQAYEQL